MKTSSPPDQIQRLTRSMSDWIRSTPALKQAIGHRVLPWLKDIYAPVPPRALPPYPVIPASADLERLHQALPSLKVFWPVEAIRALEARRADRRFHIGVFGNIKSGKSALLNALLGTEMLPSRNETCTYFPAHVIAAATDGVLRKVPKAGEATAVSAADLAALLREEVLTSRRGGEQGLARYELKALPPLLEERAMPFECRFIDTPGANESDGLGVSQAAILEIVGSALEDIDFAVVVLNYQTYKDVANQYLLNAIAAVRPDLFHHGLCFVFNKVDAMTFKDRPLAEVEAEVLLQLEHWGAKAPRLFSVSAKQGLQSRLVAQGHEGPDLLAELGAAAFQEKRDRVTGELFEVRLKGQALAQQLWARSGLEPLEQELLSVLRHAHLESEHAYQRLLSLSLEQAAGELVARQQALEAELKQVESDLTKHERNAGRVKTFQSVFEAVHADFTAMATEGGVVTLVARGPFPLEQWLEKALAEHQQPQPFTDNGLERLQNLMQKKIESRLPSALKAHYDQRFLDMTRGSEGFEGINGRLEALTMQFGDLLEAIGLKRVSFNRSYFPIFQGRTPEFPARRPEGLAIGIAGWKAYQAHCPSNAAQVPEYNRSFLMQRYISYLEPIDQVHHLPLAQVIAPYYAMVANQVKPELEAIANQLQALATQIPAAVERAKTSREALETRLQAVQDHHRTILSLLPERNNA